MPKHAFLIIAHNNFSVLERLLTALSHPCVEIYLHVDAKVQLPTIDTGNAHIHLIKDRVDTRWGDISQIETEYSLLEAAIKDGGYIYYHIISGVHFPLQPIDRILSIFEEMEGRIVFSGLCQASKYQETRKLRHYNILTRYFSSGPTVTQRFCQVLNRIALDIQSMVGIRRNKEITFYKASNWASFTEEAVRILLLKKAFVQRVFKYSFCGDEFFAPTVLLNSEITDKVSNYEMYLKQEMGEASPRVFCNDDYDDLIHSGYLFARKFNDKNINVVDRLLTYITH